MIWGYHYFWKHSVGGMFYLGAVNQLSCPPSWEGCCCELVGGWCQEQEAQLMSRGRGDCLCHVYRHKNIHICVYYTPYSSLAVVAWFTCPPQKNKRYQTISSSLGEFSFLKCQNLWVFSGNQFLQFSKVKGCGVFPKIGVPPNHPF